MIDWGLGGVPECLHVMKHYDLYGVKSMVSECWNIQLLKGYPMAFSTYWGRLAKVGRSLSLNQVLFSRMIGPVQSFIRFKEPSEDNGRVLYDGCNTLLRQFMREWSKEGAKQRGDLYGTIVKILKEHVNLDGRVLVPGAGLGRLAYEIAKVGYNCHCNESVPLMIVAFKYIFGGNFTPIEIYPHASIFSYLPDAAAQLTSVFIPDQVPRDTKYALELNTEPFLHAHGNDVSKWDAIVTCFYGEMSTNAIEYIRLIHKALKPKGIWINCGSLNYESAGLMKLAGVGCLELTWEEIHMASLAIGFIPVSCQIINTTFTGNPLSQNKSMLRLPLAVYKKK